MSTDAVSTATPTLPPRAAIAQLSLQLRASLQEAAAAEAESAAVDPDVAIAKLQTRVGRVIDARRRSLAEELDEARAAAAAAVSAVQGEVSTVGVGTSSPSEALPPINIVIDAEAFARVIATVLGEYLTSSGLGGYGVVAGPAPQAPKRESRTSARPLDVLLSGLAALILLVIVAAWLA